MIPLVKIFGMIKSENDIICREIVSIKRDIELIRKDKESIRRNNEMKIAGLELIRKESETMKLFFGVN